MVTYFRFSMLRIKEGLCLNFQKDSKCYVFLEVEYSEIYICLFHTIKAHPLFIKFIFVFE